MKKNYTITNMCNNYKFVMELSAEAHAAVMALKDELGYVMEDISIEEYADGDMDDYNDIDEDMEDMDDMDDMDEEVVIEGDEDEY